MSDNIKIKNIYYMLAYAYQTLNEVGFESVASEDFDNVHDLLAAILAKGVAVQIKRGLHRDYLPITESLCCLRGKINVTASVKQRTMMSSRMICQYDTFSEDTNLNRILKSAMNLLYHYGEIKKENIKALRKALIYFDAVKDVDPNAIDWRSISYHRNNATYRMLINICWLVIKGLLQTTETGSYRLTTYMDDQLMYHLYEKFVLCYYKKEHPQYAASASYIDWDIQEDDDKLFLPIMKSDITLSYGGKILIIDTKCYGHAMQINSAYGEKATIISGHLYQIFTYVKNKDKDKTGLVGGVLLYAKTNDEVFANNDYIIGGNKISVKTLDLNTEFVNIKTQLDELVEAFFGDVMLNQRLIADMAKYLHHFESRTAPYSVLEVDMQQSMVDFGFVDLWQKNQKKYNNVESIRIDNASSYKPAIDNGDFATLKVMLAYTHRRITHWSQTSLLEYSDFFIYALRKLLTVASRIK